MPNWISLPRFEFFYYLSDSSHSRQAYNYEHLLHALQSGGIPLFFPMKLYLLTHIYIQKETLLKFTICYDLSWHVLIQRLL